MTLSDLDSLSKIVNDTRGLSAIAELLVYLINVDFR